MRPLREIRGLKYPDDFVLRFFFKRGHHERLGRVLELGCGSGNNLGLYDAYGWEVTGLDISKAALDEARYNLNERGHFIQHDMADGIPHFVGRYDVVLMANSMCYIPRQAFVLWLRALAHLGEANKAEFYLRLRTPRDYRFGRGRPVEHNGYILDCNETGESGCLNVFYEIGELKDLLRANTRAEIDKLTFLSICFDNVQAGQIMSNTDVVIWGQI